VRPSVATGRLSCQLRDSPARTTLASSYRGAWCIASERTLSRINFHGYPRREEGRPLTAGEWLKLFAGDLTATKGEALEKRLFT
jgi:hypothetical protein